MSLQTDAGDLGNQIARGTRGRTVSVTSSTDACIYKVATAGATVQGGVGWGGGVGQLGKSNVSCAAGGQVR